MYFCRSAFMLFPSVFYIMPHEHKIQGAYFGDRIPDHAGGKGSVCHKVEFIVFVAMDRICEPFLISVYKIEAVFV